MMAAWKIPLKRALITTPVPVGRTGHCDPLCIRRFVYAALAHAGMQNRSPFSLLSLFDIWRRSRGKPAAVRHLCLTHLNAMDRPALSFSHSYTLIIMASCALLLWSAIAPQTADTNLVRQQTDTILELIIPPVPDIDLQETYLPISSDYTEAPSPTTIRTSSEMFGSEWILHQPDHHYVLQLLSANDPAGLLHFCQQHLICQNSAYYHAVINDKPIYRLLFGQFPNNKSAQHALKQLPPALKKLKPWSRQLGRIKQEIRG